MGSSLQVPALQSEAAGLLIVVRLLMLMQVTMIKHTTLKLIASWVMTIILVGSGLGLWKYVNRVDEAVLNWCQCMPKSCLACCFCNMTWG